MELFAHTRNLHGTRQSLLTHLNSVAALAGKFASHFGGEGLAYSAGLWHDVGKIDPAFQQYLERCETDPGRRHFGPDHKGLGAREAARIQQLLAFLINGHHGGLPSVVDLKNKLMSIDPSEETKNRLQMLTVDLPGLLSPLGTPAFAQSDSLTAEFFIRMLFSTLVDADFLDTEAHFFPDRLSLRERPSDFRELWELFESDQEKLLGLPGSQVNQIRNEVYRACLEAADHPQGLFRLSVPTGGGKTRSSLAFALRHTIKHDLNRVIVAIPFTSIIEQTAEVYRSILGSESVLEHHSMVTYAETGHEGADFSWSRLASENWDTPLIVTTTVQLFESLFSNMPSRCRKLHNIAKSVIILDEVQSLPVSLLTPILDVIQQLVDHYQVTAVFCTATQPEYSMITRLGGKKNLTEIAQDPERLFSSLKRVNYTLPMPGEVKSWEKVAESMREERQVLAVLNTKKDAISLYEALGDSEALHLSTLLCGMHRREVLEKIKDRLSRRIPCRLVSTQVVESGVDVDFPVVYRAMGPLDSIVQAAGRCNREGRLGIGEVIVFVPEDGGMPPGAYRSGEDTARCLMERRDFDFDNPMIFSDYFRMFFQTQETDSERIQELRAAMDYPKVASSFRMIKDDKFPVVVRYRGSSGEDNTVDHLLRNFDKPGFRPGRWILRDLQPFMVNIRSYDLERYKRDGLVKELAEGLFEWVGKYDPVRGLDAKSLDPADLII